MEFQDNVVVRFTGDIKALEAAINKASGLMKKMPDTTASSNKDAAAKNNLSRQTRTATNTNNAFNRSTMSTTKVMKELQAQTSDFTTSFRRAALSLQTGSDWLDKFSIQADRASMMMWKFTMAGVSLNQLAATTGAVAVGFGMVSKKMVESFSMIDRLKRQFSNIYQSAEIGNRMVDKLVDSAVRIRYTIQETLEAGRLLAVEGFNPEKYIMDMADLAAGVNQEGITIVNATRAFADAAKGQFRRLKETFQISRQDAMAFAPDAFAGPNNQISNQTKAVDAIIRAIRAKFRGQNDATMQTVSGMLSNLDDAMAKSMAKMGAAINDTVVGWISSLMGFFEKVSEFADTDLGKATANTILWGAAIMSAVTALALLGSGMITLLGLFAAYKVFMDGRTGSLKTVLEAEMKLMKLNSDLAAIEAGRSLNDIKGMEAKLVLLQAIHAEEKARMQLIKLEGAGVTGPRLIEAQRGVKSAAAAQEAADADYRKVMLPKDIMEADDAILEAKIAERKVQADINALNRAQTDEDRAQLATARESVIVAEQKAAALRSELAAARAGRAVDVGAVAVPAVIDAGKEDDRYYNYTRKLLRRSLLQDDVGHFEKMLGYQEETTNFESRRGSLSGFNRSLEKERELSEQLNLSRLKLVSIEQEISTIREQGVLYLPADRVREMAVRERQLQTEIASVQAVIQRKTEEMANNAIILQRGNLSRRETVELQKQLAIQERQIRQDQRRLADLQASLAIRQQWSEGVQALPVSAAPARRGPVDGGFVGGFASGFKGVMGAAFSPILGMVEMFTAPFKQLIKSLNAYHAAVLAGEKTWGNFIGKVSGSVIALAALVAVGALLYLAKKREQEAIKTLESSLNSASTAAREWGNNLPIPPWMQPQVDLQAGMDKVFKNMEEGDARKAYTTAINALRFIFKPWDYAEHTVQVGEKMFQNSGENLEQTKEYLRQMAAAAKDSGSPLSYGGEELTAERINQMSENEIRAIEISTKEVNGLLESTKDFISEGNTELNKQQEIINQNALAYAEAKLQAGGLTEEQKKFYNDLKESTTPATVLSQMLKETYKDAKESVPEFESAMDVLNKVGEDGKILSEAEAFDLLKSNAETANSKLAEMKEAKNALANIDLKGAAERDKEIRQMEETVRLINEQYRLRQAIANLLQTQNAQGMMGAAGLGNIGAVFGPDIVKGEWAAAALEGDPVKKMERAQNAFKGARALREDEAKQSLDLFAPGPNASAAEKIAYEKYRADVERKRMAGVEADYRRAMDVGKLTPEQRERVEKQLAVEKAVSARTIGGFDKTARDLEMQQTIGMLEARKGAGEVMGLSARDRFGLEMDVLRVKMREAVANKDIAAQMELQVEAARALKLLGESALSDAEAKLSFMQTQADMGLISQEAVDMEKRKLAEMYRTRAQQAAYGSAEYYQNMQKSMELLKDETEDSWSGIIGKILGAPQSLIDQVVSSGWISQQFGNMENVLGLGRGIQAEIASQSRREVVVRVNWENLDAVSNKVEAVLPRAMGAFAKEFTHGMSTA